MDLFAGLVLTRRRLDRNSNIIGVTWDERVKIVQESLGGIRDVIIDSSQPVYLEAFRRVEDRLSSAKTNTAFISTAPRFIIELLGMALIAVLAIVMASREGGLAAALPIFARGPGRPAPAADAPANLRQLVDRRRKQVADHPGAGIGAAPCR